MYEETNITEPLIAGNMEEGGGDVAEPSPSPETPPAETNPPAQDEQEELSPVAQVCVNILCLPCAIIGCGIRLAIIAILLIILLLMIIILPLYYLFFKPSGKVP